MFKKFKKEPIPQSPINDDRRTWVEENFHWLTTHFDPHSILNRKVLIPHYSDFPIRYNGDPQTADETLNIVATQMEIHPSQLTLTLQDNRISTGGGLFGNGTISLVTEESDKNSGTWQGKNADGKYPLSLNISALTFPETMVATLARQLARIKLIGEGRMTEIDEPLTDLTTVIFGLGVFNANAALATFPSGQSWGWTKLGALTQMEWGYALALFARFRNEKTPDWVQHLTKNVKSDYLKSEQFITYPPNNAKGGPL
jgi:hypothetical protein